MAAHFVSPHKEFRFLLPVLPPCLVLAGADLADAFDGGDNARPQSVKTKNNKVALLSAAFLLNALPLAYLAGPDRRIGVHYLRRLLPPAYVTTVHGGSSN